MIRIDCSGCSICCQNASLTPVLLPAEEKKFRKYSKKIKTPYRDIFVLKKKKGKCILLEAMRCKDYLNRPTECVIYPYLMDFTQKDVMISLDNRFCPSLKTLRADRKVILDNLKTAKYPPGWIKAYNTLINY